MQRMLENPLSRTVKKQIGEFGWQSGCDVCCDMSLMYRLPANKKIMFKSNKIPRVLYYAFDKKEKQFTVWSCAEKRDKWVRNSFRRVPLSPDNAKKLANSLGKELRNKDLIDKEEFSDVYEPYDTIYTSIINKNQ